MFSPKAKLRRIRFWKNLTLAYLNKYKLVLISLIIFASLATLILYKSWGKITKSNTLTIGYVGSYTLPSIPAEILDLATQSLISEDQTGRPVANLASHWTVSPDGKTYVVFLKDNLKWHDDTPVDAKDIQIAIQNVQITALNNKAIEFKLPNPIASFPTFLDKPVFKTDSFYGTGQYHIASIDRKDDIVRKISLVPKDRRFPDVDLKFYPNEIQAEMALKVGEVKYVNISQGHDFEKWSNLVVNKKPDTWETVTIFLDTEDPLLSSKELRQALSFAINRSDFDGIRADGPLSPDSWAYNTQIKKYEYNSAKAKELISKAEIKDARIKLTVVPGLEDVAGEIKKDWEAIGIETTIVTGKTVPKKFQALLAINKLSPDPDQYSLWHSSLGGSTNLTNYIRNKKIDKLLEDGRSTQDENARRDIYFDFQRFLVEDEPAIFLYHPYKYQISYKNSQPLLSKLPKPSR